MISRLENLKLLVIEDDENFGYVLTNFLKEKGIDPVWVKEGEKAIELLKRDSFHVVLLDQKLPDRDGINLAKEILSIKPGLKIIFMTAYPDVKKAVEAIKAGAFDYLTKPIEPEELMWLLGKAIRMDDLEKIENFHQYSLSQQQESLVLIGRSKAIKDMKEFISIASRAITSPVLITGETGTGKSLLAKIIHYSGPLRHKPFVSVNCAAIPDSLIESELFGHERGAFTGATKSKKGLFEIADGGTLFLDEIGEMSLQLQAKLLHVLDTGLVRPLGSEKERKVQVRVIAASNRKLLEEVKKGNFRMDLYFRIAVLHFEIPPLRERREDIEDLAYFFLKRLFPNRKIQLSFDDLKTLKQYSFPGNIRELKNIIERAALLSRGPYLNLKRFLPEDIKRGKSEEKSEQNLLPLKEIEKDYILYVLKRMNWNKRKAAEVLGISLSTLKRRLKSWSI